MTITSDTYNDYSAIMNKDSIFNNLKRTNVQSVNDSEEKQKIEEPEKTEKERHISKEEATLLLYQYKATEIMKNQIETYFDSTQNEEDELSFQDFRDMNKALNRAELLRYYQEEERFKIQQEKEKNFSLWA